MLGAASKDSRMKYHGTASACSIAPYKISRLFCPQCKDLIIAATQSQHVSTNEIRHWWTCENCGHEYRTTVRWLPSIVDREALVDEEVVSDEPEPPLRQSKPLPALNFPRGLIIR
jgi:DNA-directed RNA polymerase subunit M/transcription elongation factor TFIIS